jgi:hypothetical protein
MSPVRLGGVVVRLAAIAPLRPWIKAGVPPAVEHCTRASCPTVLANGRVGPRVLTAGASASPPWAGARFAPPRHWASGRASPPGNRPYCSARTPPGWRG